MIYQTMQMPILVAAGCSITAEARMSAPFSDQSTFSQPASQPPFSAGYQLCPRSRQAIHSLDTSRHGFRFAPAIAEYRPLVGAQMQAQKLQPYVFSLDTALSPDRTFQPAAAAAAAAAAPPLYDSALRDELRGILRSHFTSAAAYKVKRHPTARPSSASIGQSDQHPLRTESAPLELNPAMAAPP